LIIASLMLLLSFVATSSFVKKGKYYSVPHDIHSVILGHSHPACAFNDKIIHGFYNLSQFTEGYPYSYFKAKVILENNSHIKNVFIEYTNNQIGYWAKERVFGSYMSINMERMFPLLDKNFTLKSFYTSKNISEISSSLIKSYKKNLDFIFSDSPNYLEKNWHDHKAPDHIFDTADTIAKKRNQKEFVNFLNIQEENLRYLFAIKQLCKKYGVNLFLIRSPLPKYVRDGDMNEDFFLLVKQTYFSEIPFLDFSNYPLTIDNFADNSHLNVEGSRKFSRFFYDSLVKQVSFSNNDIENIVSEKIKRMQNEN